MITEDKLETEMFKLIGLTHRNIPLKHIKTIFSRALKHWDKILSYNLKEDTWN